MQFSALVVASVVWRERRLVDQRKQAQESAGGVEGSATYGDKHGGIEGLPELITKKKPLAGLAIKCQFAQLGFLAQGSEKRPWRTNQFLRFAFCLQDSRPSSHSRYSGESFASPLVQSMEKSGWHQN